jgi:hypothetical protein
MIEHGYCKRVCRARGLFVAFALVALVQSAGCRKAPDHEGSTEFVPSEDIKRVMNAHVNELMAIPGVVAVAIGALDNGKPCLLVFVSRETSADLSRIPREIEGYPVKVEESGKIRAMPKDTSG